MKFEDLLPMTFGDVINNYCILYSPECDHVYGIADCDEVDEIFKNYKIDEDTADQLSVESVIWWGLMIDTEKDMLGDSKIKKILDDLGIEKRS